MSRRSFLVGVAAWLAAQRLAVAQPPARVVRIGYLFNGLPASELRDGKPTHPQPVAFLAGMRELGWVEGKNFHIVWKTAEGRYARLPQLARELVQLPVDVIVAAGPGVDAAAFATRTTPIVMCASYNPVEVGLAESLARPGRNVTGLTFHAGEGKKPKQLSLLKQAVPRLSRVAFVTAARGSSADSLPEILSGSELSAAAAALGVDVFVLTFGDLNSLPAVMQSAVRQGASALLFEDDPLFHRDDVRRRVATEAARLRIPVMLSTLAGAESGALLAYGVDAIAPYRRAASYVDRILRGEKPGEIPIEQPTNVMLHLNLRAAQAIGLEIPGSVMLQADRVFE